MGQGLLAVAAALSDPETISAHQDEQGDKQYRTFYYGMHQISGGLNNAGDGISQLAEVLYCLTIMWECDDSYVSDVLACDFAGHPPLW